ncbi:MAG: transglutaminase-like domain-containing protein [Thermodesulfobacteriota bacterium]
MERPQKKAIVLALCLTTAAGCIVALFLTLHSRLTLAVHEAKVLGQKLEMVKKEQATAKERVTRLEREQGRAASLAAEVQNLKAQLQSLEYNYRFTTEYPQGGAAPVRSSAPDSPTAGGADAARADSRTPRQPAAGARPYAPSPRMFKEGFSVENARDLLLIRRNVLNLEPRIEEAKDSLEQAILLRNHVYSRVPLKPSQQGTDFMKFFEEFHKSVYDPNHGHICGGLTNVFMVVCEAFGIPSRYAGLFSDVKEPYDSHATVEVFVDGKWVAMDPTYNVMLKEGNSYIGYQRVRELILAGKPYSVTTNGMEVFPDRVFENYPVPLKDLVRYLIVYPATVRDQRGKATKYPMVLLPRGWDGKIQGKERQYNLARVTPFYNIISNGILR